MKYPKITLAIALSIIFLGLLFAAEWITGLKRKSIELKSAGNARVILLREYPPGLSMELTRLGMKDNIVDRFGQNSKTTIRSDVNGFIEPSGTYKNPDLKIVFLGGSTTECLWVDENMRFPYLAGQMLGKQTGLKVNTYNAAFSGNDLRHSVNVLWNKALSMEPKYVVIMHNINDLNLLRHSGSYWDLQRRSHLIDVDDLNRKTHFSYFERYKNSWFPNLQTLWINTFSSPSGNEWDGMEERELGLDTASIKKDYKRALISIVSICKTWNISPVLMTQPNLFSKVPPDYSREKLLMDQRFEKDGFTYEEFEKLYASMNDIIRSVALENDAHLIDLDKLLLKERSNFYDLVHLSETGSVGVSEIISEHFVQWEIPQLKD